MATRVNLPFRYPGGKYYALSILKPFWNREHDEYREAMIGGGSVFFAKEKAKFNWINDIHQDLIITYRIMADPEKRDELTSQLIKEVATKERHSEVKKIVPNNDFERAFKYYYLNRTSFSGKTKEPHWGFRPKRSLPPERWGERINWCGKKLEDVRITNLDFEQVILEPSKGKKTLIFLDPPYYGVSRTDHYHHLFTKYDHIRLANLLKNSEHEFFLTYDDVPEIREMYSWAYIYPVNFFYRIGNSQELNGKREKGFELVITNYKVSELLNPKLEDFWKKEDVKSKYSGYLEPQVKNHRTKSKYYEMLSPFRYPGGKLIASRYIRPFCDAAPHDEYREPFAGSGAIFFAKPRVRYNWLNDIDKDLMNTYSIIADEQLCQKLIHTLEDEVPTKERHQIYKTWDTKDNFEAAVRYYFLNRTSYCGIMHNPAWGYREDKSSNPDKWGSKLADACKKLQNVKLTALEYKEVIEAPPSGENVLLFIDPPYCEADQKRAYKNHFTENDHHNLCELLKNTEHRFVLTYDNCKTIRDLYEWANIHPFAWQYNTANIKNGKRIWGDELIITNY